MKVTRHGQYLVGLRSGLFSAYLVAEEDGWTLVDTGQPGQAPAILAAVQELGGVVRRLTLTHAHADHTGSLDALVAALPVAELALGAREARLLAGDWAPLPGEAAGRLRGYQRLRAQPQRLLQDGDLFGSLRAVDTAGHTPGHLAFYDARDGTLISGDALFTQGGLAVAGTHRLRFCFPSLATWNRALALESGRRLQALRPTRIASGHGPVLEAPEAALQRAVDRLTHQLGA